MATSKGSKMGLVDISAKKTTIRRAVAQGEIVLSVRAFKLLMTEGSPKGDVFEIARMAGIMAAKQTPVLLPLCHPLSLEKVKVTIEARPATHSIGIGAEVLCTGKTGVEMEALTAVSAACLCIYDMMKWAGQDMTIGAIHLTHKSGGKSGSYQR